MISLSNFFKFSYTISFHYSSVGFNAAAGSVWITVTFLSAAAPAKLIWEREANDFEDLIDYFECASKDLVSFSKFWDVSFAYSSYYFFN